MGFLNSVLFIILSLIINQFVLDHPHVAATDVLHYGDELNSINSNPVLVSVSGSFTLGFFTLRTYSSNPTYIPNPVRVSVSETFTYLGIWYTDDPSRRVWVANRNRTMIGDGALMMIYDELSGTLNVIIRGEKGTNITLFNVPNQVGSGNTTRAVLEDSGNFVLYADDTLDRILWQSFDHPTDTLLPGMKLVNNLTTGQNLTLTSWLTDEIPSPGPFTLRFEQIKNSSQLVIYRREKVYWSSDWEGFGIEFLVSNFSGMYFALQTDMSLMPMLQLSSMGVLIDGGNNLLTPSLCYGDQNQDGCAISSLPICRRQSDSFQLESGTTNLKQREQYRIYLFNQHEHILEDDDSSDIGIGDCMQRCWNDCNCIGFSSSNSNGTGCTTWNGDAKFVLNKNYPTKIGVLISQKPLKTTAILRQGDELNSLNPTSNLVSADGSFTLGFFTLQNFTYLGIWYTNYYKEGKVWVANGDIPMIGDGSLMIYQDSSRTLKGIIKLGSGTNITFFSISNQGYSGNTARLVLEDSGNLVLYANPTRNLTLWQSFDHPTNTLLPGMKLGYNLTTGQNWTLTSWFNDDKVAASGAFTLRLEQIQNSAQLVIYRRGKVYWSSGLWVDSSFEFLHLYDSYFSTGTLVSDASGMYFVIQHTVEFYMLQLSSMGGLFLLSSMRGLNIVTPTLCYGFDSHDGCAVSDLPNCQGKRNRFHLTYGEWHGNLIQYDDSSNISLSDCIERCWNDCNCKAFSTQINGTGCFTWGKDALFSPYSSKSTQGGTLYSRKPPKKNFWSWYSWVLLSLTILVTSAITIYLFYQYWYVRILRFVLETTYLCYARIRWCVIEATYWCYVRIGRLMLEEKQKRRRDDYIHQLTGSASFNYGDEIEMSIKDAPDVKIFSLKAILTATDNFSSENKLGEGGYGPVYKGNLFDGRQIAVKRLSKTSGQGIVEFKNELILISKLQHTNLVRLYGCCIHQQEKMLIYELMPNKSLDFFLFGAEDKKETINWQIRFNIIDGVAQGLLYLHKYSRMKVIHRDLKVSNVLLDNDMNPKIADFGMARIFQQNDTEAITKRVVGTYGYMAPEYAMRGTFSIKSDVFSFGVLILEIVSGKKNTRFYSLDRALTLLGYAWELWEGDKALELKDESLGESYDLKQLFRTIHVGLLCVQENADERPTIAEVISMLNNEIANLPNPKQPAFSTSTLLVEEADILPDQNIQVSNGLTITVMEAR